MSNEIYKGCIKFRIGTLDYLQEFGDGDYKRDVNDALTACHLYDGYKYRTKNKQTFWCTTQESSTLTGLSPRRVDASIHTLSQLLNVFYKHTTFDEMTHKNRRDFTGCRLNFESLIWFPYRPIKEFDFNVRKSLMYCYIKFGTESQTGKLIATAGDIAYEFGVKTVSTVSKELKAMAEDGFIEITYFDDGCIQSITTTNKEVHYE